MLAQRERDGLRTPWWDDRPLLFEDLQWAWDAYQELATCKPLGFGAAGPIPWTAIHEYAAYWGMSADEEEELTAYVRAIDIEMDRKEE